MGFFDLPKAMMLSSRNAERAEAFKVEAKALVKRAKSLDEAYGRSLQRHFDKDLARFAADFGRLRGLRGAEGAGYEAQLPQAFPAPSRQVSAHALRTLTDLGAEVGRGEWLTLATVRRLARAEGPAATRVTIAWLGGLSPGVDDVGVAGGQARVADIVVLPIAVGTGLWLARVGSRELAKQEKVAVDLKKALARLKRQRAVVDRIEVSLKRATKALRHLAARIRRLLTWLESVLEVRDDIESFAPDERHRLTTLGTLTAAMTALMACPPVIHVSGRKNKPVTRSNDLLPLMLDAADALLAGVPGGEPGDEAAGAVD